MTENTLEAGPLSFGEYLKTVRLRQRLSLTRAAKRMGMTPQRLSDIESGRRYAKRISLNLVTLAARAYGLSIAEIVRNTETAVHSDRTLGEIMTEAVPLARMAELLAKQNFESARQYSHEQETLAANLYKHVRDVRALLSLMKSRHLKSEKASTLDPLDDETLTTE